MGRVTEVPLVRPYYDTIIGRINERGTPARAVSFARDAARSFRSWPDIKIPRNRAFQLCHRRDLATNHPRAALPLMSLATARGKWGGGGGPCAESATRVAAVE